MDGLVVSLTNSLEVRRVSKSPLLEVSITASGKSVSLALSAVKPTNRSLFRVTISSGRSWMVT